MYKKVIVIDNLHFFAQSNSNINIPEMLRILGSNVKINEGIIGLFNLEFADSAEIQVCNWVSTSCF